jgi:hypothetical protein
VKTVDTGGPAFPSAYGTTNGNDGLTMRDYFAGQAISGLVGQCSAIHTEMLANIAYNVADAMIAVRSGHGRPTGEA